jgi:hypothetical protein
LGITKTITFFMIVTNYDALMADYAIKSYYRLYDRKDSPWSGDHFTLLVYANCLDEANRERYLPAWRQIPFVQLYDNAEKARTLHLKAGDVIVSPEGVRRDRDSSCENYDELWTTELRKIETPYCATVDADFELLDTGFYFAMMNELERDERLIGCSCQYEPDRVVSDSYSGETIQLAERWHTCFCIYKKSAHLCTVSHFYYQLMLPNGMRYCYDSAGYFQHHLTHTFGWTLRAIGDEYSQHFIHYGAFSKNRSLSRRNIGVYRRLAIAAQTGRLPGMRPPRIAPATRTAALVRKVAKRSLDVLFAKHIAERGRYCFDEPAYTQANRVVES